MIQIVGKAKRALIGLLKRKAILGYREHLGTAPSGRALLSYLVLPLLPPPSFRDRAKFSNRGIAQQIPQALNELGYVVDIIDYENMSWSPRKNYDLFIGHGGVNFERLSRLLPGKATRIYFSTGLYWKESNLRLAQRLFDVASRRNCLLAPERSIKNDEDSANAAADGIICLGNRRVRESYAGFPGVININNAAFPIAWDRWKDKNFDAGREHFLFFSGRGNVHKGLDLLLEAFEGTALHLHICQHMQDDFFALYRKELTGRPNIHINGFIKMRSRRFEELVMGCNWLISATCAEGQPGAVLEGMAFGLIPILPDAANIDLDDNGIQMASTRVEDIRSLVIRASRIDPESCRFMSVQSLSLARDTYSVENFRSCLKRAIAEIVAGAGGKS